MIPDQLGEVARDLVAWQEARSDGVFEIVGTVGDPIGEGDNLALWRCRSWS
jgi:hypothetical protein